MGQIYFVPHGGGPLPLLNDPGYARLAAWLRTLNPEVAGKKAIILVTAHWESERPSLTSSSRPRLLYDYRGFPEEAYRIEYPAPGAPDLAKTVSSALTAAGFDPVLDQHRGFDHGVFVPMALILPEADIPILQMSVLSSLDPAQHLSMGRALAPLMQDEIILIGSGFSFHNLAALTGRLGPDVDQGQSQARAFHAWLDDVICGSDLLPEQRERALISWAEAPGARFCQPREEHLLPLHVCFGAAQAAGMKASQIFGEPVKGYQTSAYRWRV
jgi:aromatic ring-opening dioxygenase catalytic subunit (LigB family)